MSEIGLPMTGMLTTGQPSPPNGAVERPMQLENSVQKSLQGESSVLVSTAQIAPPEFIETDGISQTTASALTLKNENILHKITKKLPSLDASSLPNSKDSPALVADSAAVASELPKSHSQPLPILRFGSSGTAVRILQKLLIINGYMMQVDGIFGPLTETAIKAFQNRRKLIADGIVDQRTWEELTN
ncbi:MAG: peptidoglycan-binding protein [Gloeotrichia echinulata GP01]